MSLLTQASLIVTPNGEKEGRLYSVVPTNSSNGTFSVTRATTATRVNAAGLVELVPYNLLQQSENASGGNWGAQRNLASVTANNTTAPNGTNTGNLIVENSAFGSHWFEQSFNAIAGTPYTFSVYFKAKERTQCALYAFDDNSVFLGQQVIFDLSTGTVVSQIGTQTNAIENVGNGWYRCSIGVTSNASALGYWGYGLASSGSRQYTGNGTSALYMWGRQLVQGTSALDYQMTETRLNIPRLDYSLGSCPNILLEPQRTNLALWSEQFNDAAWSKVNSSVTANSTTSPSGLTNADTMTGDGTSNQHFVSQINSFTLGVSYTLSAYLKKGTNNFAQLYAFSTIGGMFANFDLNNGVVGTLGTITGSNPTSSITNVGNGWYRCAITFIPTVTSVAGFAIMPVTSASAVRAEVNTLSTSVFLWGAQLEVGAYATSYIPTTSASVTRNADVISRGNIFTNGLITASGGTWFVELRNNKSYIRDTGLSELYLGEDASSFSAGGKQAIAIRNGGGGSIPMSFTYWNGSAITDSYLITSLNPKIAIKFTATTYDLFVNGVKVLSARPISWTLSNVQFLNKLLGTTQYINSMALFPTPLTDGEMSMLTSGIYTPALAYAQLGLVSESPACLTSSVNALL